LLKNITLSDIDGFQLDIVSLNSVERRNGLPLNNYTYSYDGNMHCFSLYNNSDDDVLEMLHINHLMVAPYVYFIPYDFDNAPLYDDAGQSIMNIINQRVPMNHINNPVGIRVVVNEISTIHNNGFGANKEFDINFSIYGIWNKNGLLARFR
jgi:hypothetical protein